MSAKIIFQRFAVEKTFRTDGAVHGGLLFACLKRVHVLKRMCRLSDKVMHRSDILKITALAANYCDAKYAINTSFIPIIKHTDGASSWIFHFGNDLSYGYLNYKMHRLVDYFIGIENIN